LAAFRELATWWEVWLLLAIMVALLVAQDVRWL
jgi:hypothetical protein